MLRFLILKYLIACCNVSTLEKSCDREDYFEFARDKRNISIKNVRISSIVQVKGKIYVPKSKTVTGKRIQKY